MKAGKIVEGVMRFLARIGRVVLGIVAKKSLERCKRLLSVWTRRYPVEFFAGVAAVVLVFWLFSPFYMRLFFGESAGTKGDSFGALTSLFTGAAFVGLIATLMQQQREIRMQRQDLKLQRDEMKETRGELAGQKEQMALQNRSLKQQMFEQTFFNMLNLLNRYIDNLVQERAKTGQEPKRGRDQLEEILSKLTAASSNVSTGQKEYLRNGRTRNVTRARTEREMREAVASNFVAKSGTFANNLNSYFRLIYNILNLVDRSEIEEKIVYTDILQAQLSDSELRLIALHCARKYGVGLHALVERYELLVHLPKELNGVDIHEICDEIRRLDAQEAKQA